MNVQSVVQCISYTINVYRMHCLLAGCPSVVRADRGTENANVATMQRFFRRNDGDCFSGDKSFMYGRSTANQVDAERQFLFAI